MNKKNNLKVHFYGGTDSVTGANFILEDGETQIMVDCGMIQGRELSKNREINGESFDYNPGEVDFLLVTHSHSDHIGRIPKLVHDGFNGVIYSTLETKEITSAMFEDSLRIMSRELQEYKTTPIYDEKDVQKTLLMWQTKPYNQEFDLGENFSVDFKDAGHILGSVIASIHHKPLNKNIVFTGDLGNSPSPLIKNTDKITDADYLIMESVYGDRNHEDREGRLGKIKQAIKETIERQGTLLIPVFSIEKTQIILHELNDLIEKKLVPSVPVFLDSPLASKVTEIYARYSRNFNKEIKGQIDSGDDIFDFPKFNIIQSKKDSGEIYKIKGPKIIIAGSGMSTAGRILEHEKLYLPEHKNAILFVGYQAVGTLGRRIKDGAKKVFIENIEIPVNARLYEVYGYSSHKDSDNLVDFVADSAERLQKVFVVMGEPKAAMFLTQRLRNELNVKAIHPQKGDVVILK